MVFCTLFDSNYLDKGLALYQSLENHTSDFKLYVAAFDEIAYQVLEDMELKHMVVINLPDMEDEGLLEAKKNRSRAEYCWTCTPAVIEYVLKNYGEETCTYIDADLYFFRSPEVLFQEIQAAGCSVEIIAHRFGRDIPSQDLEKNCGKYCVQFNMFRADERGLKVLGWWKEKCLDWCYNKIEPDRFGDQKYLDCWMERFEGVYELRNLGAGVAKWNLRQYRLASAKGDDIRLIHKASGQTIPLVFYHFHDMKYLSRDFVNIDVGRMAVNVKYAIYYPYLREIERIRGELMEKFQISFWKEPEPERVSKKNQSRAAWVVEEAGKVLELIRTEGAYRAAYKVWYRLWRNDKRDVVDLRGLRI